MRGRGCHAIRKGGHTVVSGYSPARSVRTAGHGRDDVHYGLRLEGNRKIALTLAVDEDIDVLADPRTGFAQPIPHARPAAL